MSDIIVSAFYLQWFLPSPLILTWDVLFAHLYMLLCDFVLTFLYFKCVLLSFLRFSSSVTWIADFAALLIQYTRCWPTCTCKMFMHIPMRDIL